MAAYSAISAGESARRYSNVATQASATRSWLKYWELPERDMSAVDKDSCPEDRAAVRIGSGHPMAMRTPRKLAVRPSTGTCSVVRCPCRLHLLWSDKKTARR